MGRQITVTVDGGVVIPYTGGDDDILHGVIGLEAFAADGARFDDIRLYSVTPQCYDAERNGDEIGVDCGGSCPFQDCCANRAWDADLGERGVDCGGSCSLACQPTDRDRLFAGMGDYTGCDGRIYLSDDRGLTWQKVLDVDPASDWDNGFISSLTFDPTNPSILYATTGISGWCGGGSPGDPNPIGFGIWKSTDRGDSWFPINSGLLDLTLLFR